MFTGLVDSVGTVRQVRRGNNALTLAVAPDAEDYGARPGDSIAVDGVCLTVESISGDLLFFTAVHETLARSTLIEVAAGNRVNLERALRPIDRLGGHIVLAHADGVGRVVGDRAVGKSVVRTIWVPEDTRPFMAPKGSVAVDGVGMTIVDVDSETITVSLIPHTLSATTMGDARAGDKVNIESDVVARYVARLLKRDEPALAPQQLDADPGLLSKLENLGF